MISVALLIAAATPTPPQLTAQDVRDIRATCGLPKSWLFYRDSAVHMTPPKGAPDEKIDCMLREATKNFPHVGFVGDEQSQ